MEACFPRALVPRFTPDYVPAVRADGPGVVDFETLRPPDLDCLASAGTSCAAARACLGIYPSSPDACPVRARCEGDTAILCYEPSSYPGLMEVRYDCASRGMHCFQAPGPDGDAGCGVRACTGSTVCPSAHVAELCTSFGGTRLERCGSATCDPTQGCLGAPCTANVCDGDVGRSCRVSLGVFSPEIDCSVWGQECFEGACRGAHSECDFLEANVCDGDSVVYCALSGRRARYDCRALGFAGCADGRCVASDP